MKITLLGDSIRLIGYGKVVPELLGEDFEVFQPRDNGRFAKYTLRNIFDCRNAMEGSSIVHWNNGLWDVCDLFGEELFSPLEEYVATISRIADVLLKNHEKVIFATTTPVRNHPHIYNEDIERYNKAIVPVLEEKGVIINDLHTTIAVDIDRFIRHDDCIHLTDEGIEVAAKQVAEIIRKVSEDISK